MDAMAITAPLLLMNDVPSDMPGMVMYVIMAILFCIFAWFY